MAPWEAVFDAEATASIGAFAVNARDDNDVWVGTAEANPRNTVEAGAGVFRSRDGGKTWSQLGLQQTQYISTISLDPRDRNTAVVGALSDIFADASDRGIYLTNDGATTGGRRFISIRRPVSRI